MIKGNIVSIITPMDKKKRINFKDFNKLIKFQIKNKVDCILFSGTSGEGTNLSFKEKKYLLKEIRKVDKNIPIILGSSENDIHKVKKTVKNLKKFKLSGILQTPPYYISNSERSIIKSFKEISKINLPIIIYDVPNRTGTNLNIKLIKKLSKIKNIFGIKESQGDIKKSLEIITKTNLKLFSGDDYTSPVIMNLGAEGVISVTSNIFPKIVNMICKNRKLSKKNPIWDFNKLLFCNTNPIPIKWIMNKVKMISTDQTRLPLCKFEKKFQNKLLKIYKKL
ncbi:4-hydroxy-tetrahydrodipicolinate synthase [Candidatus Vidania fulgoroideorum]